MSDPEYDADYVVAFTDAEDDELAAADAERQTTAGGGCLSTTTIFLAVVIVLAFSVRYTYTKDLSHQAAYHYFCFAVANLRLRRSWPTSFKNNRSCCLTKIERISDPRRD